MANPPILRHRRVLVTVASLATLLGVLPGPGAVASVASAPRGWQAVRYAGATFLAPSDWAVVRLEADPAACVRLDVSAVYLGTQGSQARCPSAAVGRTQTIQVSRIRATQPGAHTWIGAQPAVVAPASPIDHSLTVDFPRLGVRVTATYGGDRSIVRRVVGSFGAGASSIAGPPRLPEAPAPAEVSIPVAGPSVDRMAAVTATPPPTASAFVGPGFDACTAPSLASMKAWRASNFHAVGVYLGGANRACAQPELTSGWVASVEGVGWNLIPLYVGLQAPCARQRDMTPIDPSRPAVQGSASADDAVAHAAAVGLGVGTPIYFDMEGYDNSRRPCVAAVNTFLAAWTRRLHQHGYVSGVYGSSASTIAELVRASSAPRFAEPDDIWFANWDARARVYGDPYFTDGMWGDHHRIHQYRGGHTETHGGVAINIDSSQVDGAVVGYPADGSFVRTVRGSTFRMAGGAPMPVRDCASFGACRPIETLASVRSFPRYPADGTILRSVGPGRDYVVAGGAALPVSDCAAVLASCASPVTLEQPTIDAHAGGHLRAMPPAGTVVRGMPSFDPAIVRYGCRDPLPAGHTVSGVARLPDADLASLFPACAGRLVFGSGRERHRRITLMRSDGLGRHALAGTGGDDFAPAVSPDGTRIAFTGRRGANTDVWVMNADGSGLRRLTRWQGFDGFPAWSPNGRTIAFDSDRGGSMDVWTIGTFGGALHRRTFAKGFDGFPDWSPDGRSIAFSSQRRGTADIWTIGPAGGNPRRVTSLPGTETAPVWSPDGLLLAFVSAAAGGRLEVVRADGWGVTPFPSGPAGFPAWD
jgi:Domain of unknown function (DUF1906)/WD40-like Beta Propeller Repeat